MIALRHFDPAPSCTFGRSSISMLPLLAIILVVAFLLRLPGLNESVWFDELWATHLKVGNLPTLLQVVKHDVHPPFYAVFMFFWDKVFGDSEVSIRTPPMLFGLAAIVLAFVLAKRWIGERPALLTAACSHFRRPISGTRRRRGRIPQCFSVCCWLSMRAHGWMSGRTHASGCGFTPALFS